MSLIEALERAGFDMDFTRGIMGAPRKKTGYRSGSQIAGDAVNQALLQQGYQLPTTADIFGAVPQQYFEPETKIGAGINQLLRGAAQTGQFVGDALVRAPLQSVITAGRMYDIAGKAVGDYATQPTDARQAAIMADAATETDQFRRASTPRTLSSPIKFDPQQIDDELSSIAASLRQPIKRQTPQERAEMEDSEVVGVELTGLPLGTRGSGNFLPDAVAPRGETGASTETGAGTSESQAIINASDDPYSEGGIDPLAASKADPFAKILKKAMDDVATASGQKPKKELEDYKEDFAKATGINISGKVDKSQALMALGLSLMQNKAGKGFNVSNMLAAVGEAGTKAMPAFAEAKKEAKAAQLAAGKYALSQVDADEKARIAQAAAAKERLADVEMSILEMNEKKALKLLEFQHDRVLANAEARAKAIEAQNKADREAGKITNPWNDKPVVGMTGLILRKGYSPSLRTDVFYDGDGTAKKFGIAYGNTLQALNEVDTLEQLMIDIQNSPEGATARLLLDRGKTAIANLGFNQEDLFKDITYKDFETGENVTIKGISAESSIEAIQDAILAQYKRFLSQETGNGISEGDYQRLAALVGKISLLGNLNENRARLQELREFFMTPKRQIESVLAELGNRKNYISESEYMDAQAALDDVLNTSVGGLQIDKIVNEDTGLVTYDVRS